MVRRLSTTLTAAAMLSLAALTAQAADDDALRLVMNCYTCHGTDGMSPGDMPSIAGKSASYLLERLRSFRDGTRPATIMNRISKGYSDAELEAIALYLGAGRG